MCYPNFSASEFVTISIYMILLIYLFFILLIYIYIHIYVYLQGRTIPHYYSSQTDANSFISSVIPAQPYSRAPFAFLYGVTCHNAISFCVVLISFWAGLFFPLSFSLSLSLVARNVRLGFRVLTLMRAAAVKTHLLIRRLRRLSTRTNNSVCHFPHLPQTNTIPQQRQTTDHLR